MTVLISRNTTIPTKKEQLHGKVPSFRSNTMVKVTGIIDIGKNTGPSTTPTTPTGITPTGFSKFAIGTKTIAIKLVGLCNWTRVVKVISGGEI